MVYFVNKSFEPEIKVKTFSKILIGAVRGICETMPLFKKQEIKVDDIFIPGWKDSPYCSLANEWDVFTELCENWKLKAGQNLRSYWMFAAYADWERLRMTEQGRLRMCHARWEVGFSSPYWKAHEFNLKLSEKKLQLEKRIMLFVRMIVHVTMPKLYFSWSYLHFLSRLSLEIAHSSNSVPHPPFFLLS